MVATISGPTLGAVCAATGTLMASHDASSEPTRMQQRLALEAVMRNAPRPGRGRVRTKSAAALMSAPVRSEPVVQTRWRRALACQRAATTMISTLWPGELGFDGSA